jgi:hypothetical protein
MEKKKTQKSAKKSVAKKVVTKKTSEPKVVEAKKVEPKKVMVEPKVEIKEQEWIKYQELAESSEKTDYWKQQANKNIFSLEFYPKMDLV